MVLYAKFAYEFQFGGENVVYKSVKWFTSYANSCDKEECRFFWWCANVIRLCIRDSKSGERGEHALAIFLPLLC